MVCWLFFHYALFSISFLIYLSTPARLDTSWDILKMEQLYFWISYYWFRKK